MSSHDVLVLFTLMTAVATQKWVSEGMAMCIFFFAIGIWLH